MKFILNTLLCVLIPVVLSAQPETVFIQGSATYISSQNVYVKFASTDGINKGDTLFSREKEVLTPCLIVKDMSSTSCVCQPLLPKKTETGDIFFARVPKKELPKKPKTLEQEKPRSVPADSLPAAPPLVLTPEQAEKPADEDYKQKIKGRLSAASYSNLYNSETTHRMRYAFTLQGNNIGNSRFSTDNYITFRHTTGEWDEVKDNFNQALKIYSLAVNYDLDKKSNITLGRKINQRISSMGVIDGLQMEKGLGKFHLGAIAGSRPDYQDYSVNFSLLQAGVYAGFSSNKDNRFQQNTLAFIEQHNQGKVDRRFVYFQHSGTPVKNLSTFASFEVDLYEKIQNEAKNTLNLTNMYVSLRYRFSRKLSVSASYDNRKNIIFYESYKNFIDQLIDNETRQGLRLNASYRLMKMATLGVNGSWRFQKSDMNLSKNLNAYLNFSRVPVLKVSASLSANLLQTKYLNSKMLGVRFSREIIAGKFNSDAYFRIVNYNYLNYDYNILQKIAGIDFSWNLTRRLAFHIYYEGTFDQKNDTFHRFNTKIIRRF